jgi:hypothetical protein
MESADGKITGLSTVVGGATSSIVEIRVYDGSTLVCAESISGVTSTCSDLEISMAKDTSKTLTVKALVTKNTNAQNVNVSNLVVTYEDAEENTYTASAGIAGNTIHLYTVAPIISNITASAEAKDLDGTGGPEAIVGKITFSVTANGGDVWISTNKSDLAVQAISSDGTTSSVSAVVLTTSATAGTWGYKVPKDQTISFTVDATHNPESSGYWKLAITQLKWDTTGNGSNAQTWTGWAVKDLVTGYVYLTGQ